MEAGPRDDARSPQGGQGPRGQLINVGCGEYRAPEPWINVDPHIGDGVDPDVVASILALPFADESVAAVYAGHLFEHLSYHDEVPRALAELRRVLAPSGRVAIVIPDVDRAIATGDDVLARLVVTGGHRWPGDEHLWIPTLDALLRAAELVFPDAAEADLDPFWPMAFRDVPWQVAILATKEED